VKHLGGALLTLALWAGLLVALLLVALRWVDTSSGIVVVLQSAWPLAGAVLAVLLGVLAAMTGRWRVAVAAGVLLVVCAAIVVPSLRSDIVARGRDDVVVMSANLDYGAADPRSVVSAVREHRVDVLVLIEVTPAAVGRLRAAGLDTLLPGSVGRSSQGAGGTIIRARIPMTLLQPGIHQGPALAFDEPVVALRRAGGDLVLRAVHSPPPQLPGAASWRSGLAELQTWREGQPTSRPVLMAGDFNASWGHPGFRGVADTMSESQRATGVAWAPTWPQGRRLIRPFVQLDHVLSRGLGVVDAGVVHLPGTDHAAVWARLSPHAP
jgi:endonuclease/exonuclease/phosphatase (EEP) superfamily protein YafD